MPKTMPSLLIISFFPPLPICLEKPFLFCCSMEPLSLCQMGCCPMHDSFDKTNVIFYNAQLSFCCCTDPSPPKLECPVWILFLPLTSHVTGALSYSILRRALSSHLLASAGKLESSTGSICPPPMPIHQLLPQLCALCTVSTDTALLQAQHLRADVGKASLSVPWFLHLQNGYNAYLIGLCEDLICSCCKECRTVLGTW